MSERIIRCGPKCKHDHAGVNGPSGCCDEHGPYLYFCPDCHERWKKANPEKVKKIQAIVRATFAARRKP